MPKLSWGRPEIYFGKPGAAPGAEAYDFEKIATPVEDSTQLTGEKGEKIEAKVEGGASEDTKYKAPTRELVMRVRMAREDDGTLRKLPSVLHKSGSDKEYTDENVPVVLIPENNSTPGFHSASCTVNVTENWAAAEGGYWEITLAINEPTEGKAIDWDQYYATEGTGDDSGKYKITRGVAAP